MAKNINEFIKNNDILTTMRMFQSQKKRFATDYDAVACEYDPKLHKVNDKTIRKDKVVKIPVEGKFDQNGEQVYKEKTVPRVRVSVPMQRVLVERSVGFLFGTPVEYRAEGELDARETELFDEVNRVLSENKMKYADKKLARLLFKEREVAEIWYFLLGEDGNPTKMRMRLASPSNGDSLYPHYDEYDRMDAFARGYEEKDMDGKTTRHFDVYTDTMLYRYVSGDGNDGFELDGSPKLHGFSKIPVVYYRQEETEWDCVQPIIERIEDLLSNWGDTNDYFGAPSYFVRGNIQGFADKGEQGRVYQGVDGADMKVLSWDSSPSSMSAELATLTNIVFSYTQTPDVSFETMKQLGGNTSGVAIRLMFTDPHMKASVKMETFGEMFTRRLSIIKNGIVTSLKPIPEQYATSLDITPVFTPYAPKNDSELLSMISTSVGGKPTLSQEDGVRLNPLVANAEQTIGKIREEEKAQLELENAKAQG